MVLLKTVTFLSIVVFENVSSQPDSLIAYLMRSMFDLFNVILLLQ